MFLHMSLLHLVIYSVITFINIDLDIYVILWILLLYTIIYYNKSYIYFIFLLKLLSLATEDMFRWLLCPWHFLIIVFLFLFSMFVYIFSFQHYKILQAHLAWKLKSLVMSDSLWPHGLYSPWNSPGQYTGVGSLSLLQGFFPTQGLNSGLPHVRRILYQLSHQESPRILEWVAYPFSKWSSQPRSWTGVSCIAGRFFASWATRVLRISCPCRRISNFSKNPWFFL